MKFHLCVLLKRINTKSLMLFLLSLLVYFRLSLQCLHILAQKLLSVSRMKGQAFKSPGMKDR